MRQGGHTGRNYLAFSLQHVAGLSPCLRHTSAAGKSASCSLIIPAHTCFACVAGQWIFCASVKRLFLVSCAPSG